MSRRCRSRRVSARNGIRTRTSTSCKRTTCSSSTRAEGAWSWTILRPQVILGESLGSNMNLIPAIGAYGAVLREAGEPLHFPGGAPSVLEVGERRVVGARDRVGGDVGERVQRDLQRHERRRPGVARRVAGGRGCARHGGRGGPADGAGGGDATASRGMGGDRRSVRVAGAAFARRLRGPVVRVRRSAVRTRARSSAAAAAREHDQDPPGRVHRLPRQRGRPGEVVRADAARRLLTDPSRNSWRFCLHLSTCSCRIEHMFDYSDGSTSSGSLHGVAPVAPAELVAEQRRLRVEELAVVACWTSAVRRATRMAVADGVSVTELARHGGNRAGARGLARYLADAAHAGR